MAENTSTVKKPVYKKWWFWVIVVFVLMVFARMGNDKNTEKVSSKDIFSSEELSEEQEKIYNLGDKIVFEDSEWVVSSAKDRGSKMNSRNSFVDPAVTSGKFIMVSFGITNKTNKEERIMFTPVIVDAKGREFQDYDKQSFYLPEGAKSLTMESLPSGMEKQFTAIYEVPADAEGLMFQVRELSAFSPDKKNVKLF